MSLNIQRILESTNYFLTEITQWLQFYLQANVLLNAYTCH